jgi:hypothetical protein
MISVTLNRADINEASIIAAFEYAQSGDVTIQQTGSETQIPEKWSSQKVYPETAKIRLDGETDLTRVFDDTQQLMAALGLIEVRLRYNGIDLNIARDTSLEQVFQAFLKLVEGAVSKTSEAVVHDMASIVQDYSNMFDLAITANRINPEFTHLKVCGKLLQVNSNMTSESMMANYDSLR